MKSLPTSEAPVCRLMPNPLVTEALAGAIKLGTSRWSRIAPEHGSANDIMVGPQGSGELSVIRARKSDTTNIRDIPGVEDLLDTARLHAGADRVVNGTVYAPGGIMDWHTNSNMPGRKLYYTFTMGKAVFAYKHPLTGEIIDDQDAVGWTAREFMIPANPPYLWHAVWTEKVRFCFGFWFNR